jgi:hypothetical protein
MTARACVALVFLSLSLATPSLGAPTERATKKTSKNRRSTTSTARPVATPTSSEEGDSAEALTHDAAPPQERPVETATPVPTPAAGATTGASSLDFELLDAPGSKRGALIPQSDRDLDAKVRMRRTMLEWHQALGFATWAGLVATEVVGQLQLIDKYGGGGDTERFQTLHLGLALGTTGLFTAVGLLGVFAPVPYEKKGGFSTATLHKLMMAIATAGMLTQVGLGIYANAREGQLDQRAFAQAHQIVGYTTLGAMTVGAVTLFF